MVQPVPLLPISGAPERREVDSCPPVMRRSGFDLDDWISDGRRSWRIGPSCPYPEHIEAEGEYIEWFDVAFELSPETVKICRQVCTDENIIWRLAMIAIGSGDDEMWRRIAARQKNAYVAAQKGIKAAMGALNSLPLMQRMTLSNTMASLEGALRAVDYHIAQRSTKGRKVAVNRRYLLHAIAAAFRVLRMPVTVTDDPEPSAFVRVAHQLFADMGMSGGIAAVADAALKARILDMPRAGQSFPYETGAGGVMLGTVGAPTVREYNAQAQYTVTKQGGFRVECHFTSVFSVNKLIENSP